MVMVAGTRGDWSRVWLDRGFGTPPSGFCGCGTLPRPPLWDGLRRDYSDALDENIKESQWFHWVAGKDRWHEAAKVLQWVDAQEG